MSCLLMATELLPLNCDLCKASSELALTQSLAKPVSATFPDPSWPQVQLDSANELEIYSNIISSYILQEERGVLP